jgi:hypothetical protein
MIAAGLGRSGGVAAGLRELPQEGDRLGQPHLTALAFLRASCRAEIPSSTASKPVTRAGTLPTSIKRSLRDLRRRIRSIEVLTAGILAAQLANPAFSATWMPNFHY